MIYFMQAEKGGPIKIGLSKNPKRRLIGIQVNHYETIILRAVMAGDRNTELALHERFAYCWRVGEWFEPSPGLEAFVAALPQINFKTAQIGCQALDKHGSWKGPEATSSSKRQRALRSFQLGACEDCGKKSHIRKFRDGNFDNMVPENIAFLCRKCAAKRDGLGDKVSAWRKQNGPKPSPPKPCINCGRLWKPRRKGRCHNCSAYFLRKGVERPGVYFSDGTQS